jgi:hypothetical protein
VAASTKKALVSVRNGVMLCIGHLFVQGKWGLR